MKIHTIIIAYLATLISSCSTSSDRSSLFPNPTDPMVDISIMKVMETDTIYLDMDRTSFEGNISITDRGRVYFFDYQSCLLYEYDKDGVHLSRKIGKGRSRAEISIGSAYASTFLSDGSFCIIGGNDGLYTYGKDFTKDPDRTYNHTRREAPSLDNADKYDSYALASLPLVCRSYGNSVYTSNEALNPNFNYMETEGFTSEFRSITRHNLVKQNSDELLGRGLPFLYDKDHRKHHIFSSPIFDINSKGEFYVSYLADPIIYHYDSKYRTITAFGLEGKDMDCDYKEAKKIDDYQTLMDNYLNKGYYTWIEYIEELDLLLRSYQKGANSEFDGLQIYRDYTLIGDIDVPKGFKPIGYIAPYIYSDYKSDESNNRLQVVRLKLF